jgi:hypothetical protein
MCAIQGFVTVPATIAYERTTLALALAATSSPVSTGAPAAPFDVNGFVGDLTVAFTVAGAVGTAALLAAWPIARFFWSRKLSRDLADPPTARTLRAREIPR